jgi:thioredoxin-related protein
MQLQARNFAKENKKWLLVNIQDPTEFSCQVMNRDLWSEQAVKDVIKESFVFLQVNPYIHSEPNHIECMAKA